MAGFGGGGGGGGAAADSVLLGLGAAFGGATRRVEGAAAGAIGRAAGAGLAATPRALALRGGNGMPPCFSTALDGGAGGAFFTGVLETGAGLLAFAGSPFLAVPVLDGASVGAGAGFLIGALAAGFEALGSGFSVAALPLLFGSLTLVVFALPFFFTPVSLSGARRVRVRRHRP